MKSLEQAMISLISSTNDRFYGNLLIKMQRQFIQDPNFAIAGVGFDKTKIRLLINEPKFDELTLDKRVFVLKHECLHVVFDHLVESADQIPKREGVSQKQMKTLMNIAQDLVINQVDGLEEVANTFTNEEGKVVVVTPLGIEQNFELNVPRGETSSFYLELFLKEMKQNPDGKLAQYMENQENGDGEGNLELDDHSEFGEGIPEEIKKSIVRKMVNEAHQQTGMGNTPGAINSLINAMNKAQVSWEKELRSFMTNSFDMIRDFTRTRRNRRYGINLPGHIDVPKNTAAFIMDTSGSMSESALSQGWAEMQKIQQVYPDYDIWFIQADCQVSDFVKLTRATKPNISGRGGTAYQPAIDKALELGADMIIYFGDFDCADQPVDPKIPFIWLGVGNQEAPGKFGKVLRVTEK